MGQLKHPYAHKFIAASILLSTSLLSGCAAVTAISAIPGALYGVVSDQFSSIEVSFPHSMRATLAAVQHSLQTMRLDIDILEIQESGGYGIAFNDQKLSGEITLRKQTERLTTVSIQAKFMTREESVEQAIIKLMETTLKKQPTVASFELNAYHDLRAKPTNKSKHLGWFRPGAMLDAKMSNTAGWLAIKLPSGSKAFLKGEITSQ